MIRKEKNCGKKGKGKGKVKNKITGDEYSSKRKKTDQNKNKKNNISHDHENGDGSNDEGTILKVVPKKNNLNKLRPDLTCFLTKFLYLSDVVKLLDINKRIRLIISKNVKLLPHYFSLRNIFKSKKIDKELEMLKKENSDILISFLEKENFSSDEEAYLIYSILQSVSKTEAIEIKDNNDFNFYFMKRILTSDFSVCKNFSLILGFSFQKANEILSYLPTIINQNKSISEFHLEQASSRYFLDFTSVFNSLQFNSNIKTLKFASTYGFFGDNYDPNNLSLFKAVEISKTIETFSFSCCLGRGIEDRSSPLCEAITSMMENNKSVKNMKVRYYFRDKKNFDFSYLRKNSTIKIFDSSSTRIGVTAMKSLYKNLTTNESLSKIHTLILRNIYVDNSNYFKYLGDLINSNKKIKKIDISGNHCEKKLHLPLFKSLETNSSLKILILEKSKLTQEEFMELLNCRKINSTLEEVDVTKCKNYIYGDGKVVEMLNSNFTLTKFRFDNDETERLKAEEILNSRISL